MNTAIFDRIPIHQFYLALIVALSAMLVGNSVSIFITWGILNIGGKISGIAGLIMNVLWLLFFVSFYKGAKGSRDEEKPKTDEDIVNIINKEVEILKGGDKNAEKIPKTPGK